MTEQLQCRLCLFNSDSCCNVYSENLQQKQILNKLQKYLCLKIKENDSLPRNICEKCLERLNNFDTFFNEVSQNQQVLNQLITSNVIQFNNSTCPTSFFITIPIAGTTNFIPIQLSSNISVGKQSKQEPITEHIIEDSLTTVVTDNNKNSEESPNNSLTSLNDSIVSKIEVVEFDDEYQEQETILDEEIVTTLDNSISSETDIIIKKDVIELPINTESIDYIDDQLNELNNLTNKVCGKSNKNSRKGKKPNKIMKKKKTKKKIVKHNTTDIANVNDDSSSDDDSLNLDNYEYNNDNYTDLIEIKDEEFNKFPNVLIKNSKLIIRGKSLLDLMARFYRLECELCIENPSLSNNKEIFKNLNLLSKHYNKLHSMKSYVICCGIKLIKPRTMALHMARHLQPDAFKCPECDKMMTCPKILEYHIQNHLPEEKRPLACSECPRRFSYSSALIAHSISHQPEHLRAIHVCDECGKTFSSPGRLSTHINVAHVNHGNDYICHICAKQFNCRGNLTYHLTTHQPRIHQVQCSECSKWLKNKLCLRKHMVQHSLTRFSCTKCDYSALNRQCLRNHIKVQHSDAKPYNCEVCGKTFKLKTTLINHMVQHTGVKKFVCQFCTRTFASSGNYYSHRKRMHPTELAALKSKREEDERLLREQIQQVRH